VKVGGLDAESFGGSMSSFVALRDLFGLACEPPYFFLFDVVVLNVDEVFVCDELDELT